MRLAPLELKRGDRPILEELTRSATVEARTAKRARLVLLAANGESNRGIGEVIDMHYNQVAVWRKRYDEFGLAGLEDDERPGRPHVYDHDDVLLLVHLVTTEPDDASRWTMKAIAEKMNAKGVGISESQVWRICIALDLKPWQTQSWMTSHDPEFWEKAADVCGLYLDPPFNAVVWSVDEKSQMQALSRVSPTKPAVPGTPARREQGYVRHGTQVLFAGLDVHSGWVEGMVTDSTRAENFIEFLTQLRDRTPKHLDLHCIADNLSAHKTADVRKFLEKNKRVHLHFTPTHASWLNQVELFFSIIERRLLRSGEFSSKEELARRIISFINAYNKTSKPFAWTYDGRPLKIA
jgi:transposase